MKSRATFAMLEKHIGDPALARGIIEVASEAVATHDEEVCLHDLMDLMEHGDSSVGYPQLGFDVVRLLMPGVLHLARQVALEREVATPNPALARVASLMKDLGRAESEAG
jgi:hypothetical protein